MKKQLLLIPLIIILIFAIFASIYHFTRPSISLILSQEEDLLLSSSIPSGIFNPYRVKKSIYPEVKKASYYLYSPVAASLAIRDESVISDSSGVWGLEDETLPFSLIFRPESEKLWSLSYKKSGETPLLSAIIYDSSSPEESHLASLADSSFLRFTYDGTLSRVGAEVIKSDLERNGVSSLIIYSPYKAIELLYEDEGYTLTLPLLYKEVFNNVKVSSTVGEDFNAMFKALVKGESGKVETPYKLTNFDNSIKVIFNKLF